MKNLLQSLLFVFTTLIAAAGPSVLHAQADVTADKAMAEVHQTVNINAATAEQLSAGIKGVGMKKAEAIVAYREQNGSFKSKEDLLKIKGIGAKTLEKNWDRIVVK